MLSRPMIDRIAFLGISWYAILIVGSILLGLAYCSYEARRLKIPQDTIIDFLLYAIPLGIICARIYYVVFRFNMYSEDLLSIFNIREGGLAIYGAVIGGLIAARIAAVPHRTANAADGRMRICRNHRGMWTIPIRSVGAACRLSAHFSLRAGESHLPNAPPGSLQPGNGRYGASGRP